MDPVSAIGLAGSLVNICDVIAKSLKRLKELQSRYKSASLTVSLLIGQITTVKAALDQITEWVTSSLVDIPRHEQLVADLDVSLESCKLLVTVLEERISQLERDDAANLNVKGKIGFLWEESEFNTFTNHLNNQTHALNLFLTALHCRTTFERNTLLHDSNSRQIVKRVEDNKASLLSLRDSMSERGKRTSLSTEDSNFMDRDFDFDNEVITTSVYRAALRSNLQRSRQKGKSSEIPPEAPPVQGTSDSAPKPIDEPVESVGLFQSPAEFQPLPHEESTVHDPQQLSVFTSWFQTDGAITETTEVDRFSSRLSQVSRIFRRGDDASIFSSGSRAESDEISADQPLVSNPKPVRRRNTKTRKAKSVFQVRNIFKIHEHMETSFTPPPSETLFKVALLGSGNSGKSTVFKAIDSLSKGGVTIEERLRFKETIFTNTAQSMRDILEAMVSLDIPLKDENNRCHAETVYKQPSSLVGDQFPPQLCEAIEALWTTDDGVKLAYQKSNEYLLQDSAAYFFNSVRRLDADHYIPTDEDILMARIRSTGFYKASYPFAGTTFDLFDTGGERSERKKWIALFCERLSVIIFVVDISAYDLVLYEDHDSNRMVEDLILFESICNSKWFVKTRFILLFTKMDILEAKIQKHPITTYFPDFAGDGNSLEETTSYIESKFLSRNRDETNDIKTMFTSFSGGYNASARLVLDAIRSQLSLGPRGHIFYCKS